MNFNISNEKQGINQALLQITHGLYILTAKKGDKINGQCLDALMQVTSAPPKIAMGVDIKSLTHEMIKETGLFVVNVLDRENSCCPDYIKLFGFQSGRNIDKFAGLKFEKSESGIPILPNVKAFYECKISPKMTLELGTHTLFIAEVTRAGVKESGEPLTYNEYRKKLKKRTN